MLARKIAPKMLSLFQTFFLFFFEKPSTPIFFYLLIFHRGGWGCESKNYLAWPYAVLSFGQYEYFFVPDPSGQFFRYLFQL